MYYTLSKPKWIEKIQCVCVFHTVFDQRWSAIECVHLDSICHRSNAMGMHSHIRVKNCKHVFECKKTMYYIAVL